MKLTNKENVWKLKSEDKDHLSIPEGSTIAKMTDTGNGYIFKFPAHSCIYQDNYVVIDYEDAEYIYKLLDNIKEVFDDPTL